ncbi:MAG: flagellar export protein FliJ [Gammaproteobacteria bacterium]|nr:flagellar export protein FliJ [Gammaproteobacteria bacterium]
MSAESLDRVLTVLENETRAAEMAYRAGLENHELQKQQLQRLQDYYHEYAARRRDNGTSNIQSFRNLNLFLGTIQSAITGQEHKVSVSSETTERLKTAWIERLRREKSVRTIIDNRKSREKYLQNRADQKITDEIAALIVNGR